MARYIVLLHDEDLSGSLKPENINSHELEVYGPFPSVEDAADWIDSVGEDHRWLCQIHEIVPPLRKK